MNLLARCVVAFRALTNCDLFVLTKTDLDAALQYYPHIADQILEVARNRTNQLTAGVTSTSQLTAGVTSTSSWQLRQRYQEEEEEEEEEENEEEEEKEERKVRDGEKDKVEHVQCWSDFQDCVQCCCRKLRERVWPAIRLAVTFTISPVGKFGMFYSYTGCLLAYFSAFTISYQVK